LFLGCSPNHRRTCEKKSFSHKKYLFGLVDIQSSPHDANH
jgi:hypothetical protein